jgi:sugar phosphate isomerase/epimerase
MPRPAIQLYTLRDVDRPFTEILELVADAGFEGVEFAYRVTEEDPDDVVEALTETELEVAGAHVPVDALEEDFAETVTLYEKLTTDNVVVPWLDAEHFESHEAIDSAVERLERIDAELDEYGIEFHYHNHDHEYVDLNGETGWDVFLDRTAFGIELDLGLALFAGDDPVARLRQLGERSNLVHLKDFDVEAGESAPVGEGDLDLTGVADAAAENDSDWIVYEYEGEDPVDTLEDAAEAVRDLC